VLDRCDAISFASKVMGHVGFGFALHKESRLVLQTHVAAEAQPAERPTA
jgi:hypothetical protein